MGGIEETLRNWIKRKGEVGGGTITGVGTDIEHLKGLMGGRGARVLADKVQRLTGEVWSLKRLLKDKAEGEAAIVRSDS